MTESVLVEEIVHYCWLDEDGQRMSPIHKEIGSALSFVATWQDWKDRIERRAQRARERHEEAQASRPGERQPSYIHNEFEREMKAIAEQQKKCTRTGKPPAKLKRYVTRIYTEEPTSAELELATGNLSLVRE